MKKILINSIPKSGTNLMQKFMHLAGVSYSGRSLAASSILGRHASFKYLLRRPRLGESPLLIGLELQAVVSPTWCLKYLMKAKGCVSGHAAYSAHLDALLQEAGYRVVQVVRHPAAVLTSWAHYIAKPGYYWKSAWRYCSSLPFEERVRFLLHGGLMGKDSNYYGGFNQILQRQSEWLRHPDRFLVVRFEDLVGERGGGSRERQQHTVEEIMKFAVRETTKKQIAYIVDGLFGGTHTFRKGQINSWEEELSPELQEEIYVELSQITAWRELGYLG